MKGKVYLVGAGPGKADLTTRRGLNILKDADVVIYDYLVDKRILENAKEGAELICCDTLGKKRYSNGFLVHQEKINNLLIKKAKEGKKVIRLKNGDPSIFSRCSQELDILAKNNVEFEVVPGVTAGVAASGLNGIPLTDRKYASSCVFVTGHEDPKKRESLLDPSTSLRINPERSRGIDWNALSKMGTIVFYMAVENLETIVSKLLEAGKDKKTPVAIIQDASLITQKSLTGTLNDIARKAKLAKIKPPAIAIVGEVVKLENKFNWFRKNKRILFTGLSQERFFIRGTYFHLPLIKIEPLDDYREFDNYLKQISEFDWVVFASRYGVDYFFKRLNAIGRDTRSLNGIKVAAIGNSTANKLKEYGIIADLVPKRESSRGLLIEFKKILKPSTINYKLSTKIFLPRSDISDKGLSRALKRLGAKVTTGFAYRNVIREDLPDLDLNKFDEIMFTSPSGVRNFKKRYSAALRRDLALRRRRRGGKEIPRHIKVRCIGDVTLKEAKRCNLLG